MTLTGLVDLFTTDPTIAEAVGDARSRALSALDLTSPPADAAADRRRGGRRPGSGRSRTAGAAGHLDLPGGRSRDRRPQLAGRRGPGRLLPGLGDAAARAAESPLRHGRAAGWPCCAGWPATTEQPPPRIIVAPVRSVLQPQVKGLADLTPVRLAVGEDVRPGPTRRATWSARRTSGSTWSSGAASSRSAAASSTSSRRPRSTRSGSTSSATRSRRSATSPSPTSARRDVTLTDVIASPVPGAAAHRRRPPSGRSTCPRSIPS